MPLSDWLANRWLVAHTPTQQDHERTILSLRETVGVKQAKVDLLDIVRRKRNQANYEAAGSTSAREADELYKIVQELRADVVRWLRKQHAALCPPNLRP